MIIIDPKRSSGDVGNEVCSVMYRERKKRKKGRKVERKKELGGRWEK